MADPQIVKLNIGGVRYRTTYSTLASVPNSVLATYLEEWTEDKRGKIFIDRDGSTFKYVLNYLRNGANVILPDEVVVLKELKQEAEFYKLPGLVQLVDKQMSLGGGCRQFQQGSQSVAGESVERVEEAASSVGVNEPEQSQAQEQMEEDILEFKVETEMPYVDMECMVEEQSVVSRSIARGTVSQSTLTQKVDVEIKAETVGQPDVSTPGDEGMEETESVPIGACNSASDDACSEQSPGIASTPLHPSDNHTPHNTQKHATKTVLTKLSQGKRSVRQKVVSTVLHKKAYSKSTKTRDTAAKRKYSRLVGDNALKSMHVDQTKRPSRASRWAKVPASGGERMDSVGTGVTRKHTSAQSTSHNHEMLQSPGPGLSNPVVRRTAREKTTVQCAKKLTQQTHKKQTTAPVKISDADTGEKVHKCKDCNLWYGKASLLNIHMKSEHTVTAHQCNVCAQFFAHAYALKLHIDTVHHGAKQFKCNKCEKRFGQKSTLNTHIKSIHEGLKFLCEECGKLFAHKTNMIHHALVHSGEKPYMCEMCGNGFSNASHLAVHRRRHLQIKPHHCPICDMAFVTSSEMKSHVRYIHPIKSQ